MKLYVKNITRGPKDTLYTFLYKVLHLDGNGFGKCVVNATYFDIEFKKQQCISHKYRSFDDIILISKTYFKVSDKIIAKTIKKLLDNFRHTSLVLCDTADKWVFYHGLNKSDDIKYCAKYKGSDEKTHESGKNGKYSFDDIITLMGLTKEDIEINNG